MSKTTLMSFGLALVLVSQSSRLDHSQAPVTPPQEAAVKAAPSTPMAEQKAELGDDETWDPDWDKTIEEALPADLLSSKVAKDVKLFCPRFNALSPADKRAFWAYFFQALAGAEAGLRSTADVRHTEAEVAVVDNVSHRMVRSEGLLQLTYEDEKRYGCSFNWDADRKLNPKDAAKTILQPKNNLECGVKILTRQIIDEHKPLFARTAYWSTLQPGTVSYRIFAKQMTNPPLACGLRARAVAKRSVAKGQVSGAQ